MIVKQRNNMFNIRHKSSQGCNRASLPLTLSVRRALWLYEFVHMCVYVCESVRDGGIERQTEEQREKEREGSSEEWVYPSLLSTKCWLRQFRSWPDSRQYTYRHKGTYSHNLTA